MKGWTSGAGGRWGLLFLVALFAVGSVDPARGETWLLKSGGEDYGELESYSFRSKEVLLRKADGKPFAFPARELSFGAKSKLIFSQAFARALPGYRPPVFPVLLLLACLLVGVLAPPLVGLLGSVHALGVEATLEIHFQAFTKILILGLVMGICWLAASVLLDPGIPVLPDTSADLVLASTSLNCGIFFCSLLVSLHYHRSFWKGMAITLLTGVFSAILWTAGSLALLFLATRRNLETAITELIFEPFGWF